MFFWIYEIFWVFFFNVRLLNITEVTTEHQKWPKISTKSVESPFFAPRAKKASVEDRSPPPELKVGLCSGPYLHVLIKIILIINRLTSVYNPNYIVRRL